MAREVPSTRLSCRRVSLGRGDITIISLCRMTPILTCAASGGWEPGGKAGSSQELCSPRRAVGRAQAFANECSKG